MICSKCGMKNSDESNFCEYCGNKLKEDPVSNENSSQSLNWKAIILGSVIGTLVGIVFILISRLFLGFIPLPFLIGIITGYIVGEGWKKGAIHAGISNLIFTTVIVIVFFILILPGASFLNEFAFIGAGVVAILIGLIVLIFCLFFGVLGGMLGAYIKEILVNRKNK